MGYNLAIYCEPKIFNSKDLQEVIANKTTFWGETTIMGKGGYYFFGDYRIYYDKSLFYQICNQYDLNFYKYFDPLEYTQGWPELIESEPSWHDLELMKNDLSKFIKLLKEKSIEELMKFSEICEGYSVLRFPGYFGNNLIPELEQAFKWIEIFEYWGAKKILIGYE